LRTDNRLIQMQTGFSECKEGGIRTYDLGAMSATAIGSGVGDNPLKSMGNLRKGRADPGPEEPADPDRVERKLAAILSTNVAGGSCRAPESHARQRSFGLTLGGEAGLY
jgi:hypothetical protein